MQFLRTRLLPLGGRERSVLDGPPTFESEDSMERNRFRLFKNGVEVRLELIGETRWKVLGASRETGFQAGDEVSPQRRLSWREAKRRVNSARSACSPGSLVLLRGEGSERSEREISEILRTRPWDPELPPAA